MSGLADRITGKKQYCTYGPVGTTPGESASTLFGLVTGGGPKGASALEFDKGIGGAWDAAGGALEGFECGVDFLVSDGVFIASEYVHRTRTSGGAFDPAAITTPFDLVAGGMLEYVYPSCYLDTLEIAFAVGKAVTATIKAKPTALPFTQARQARTWTNALAKAYRWHHVAIQVAGLSLGCQNAKVSLKNNLAYDSSLDGLQTAGSKRMPEGVLFGDEEVEVSGSLRQELAFAALTADELAAGLSFVAVAVHPTSGKTLTLSLPYLYPGDSGTGFQGDGGVTSGDFTFKAAPNSLGVWLAEA